MGLMIVSAALCAAPAAGTIYLVTPAGTGDFPTIQAAIDAAVNGDVIELADGIFTGPGNRDVDFSGKAITVRSQSGNAGMCLIDCQGSAPDQHRGFVFGSGENDQARLESVSVCCGFMVTAGGGEGGALWVGNSSSPTLKGCTFFSNHALHGGAIFAEDHSSPAITQCHFINNAAEQGGGAISLTAICFSSVTACTFWGNAAAGYGGAINIEDSVPSIEACTLVGNAAYTNGAIGVFQSSCFISNTIIAFSPGSMGVFTEAGGADLSCTDIYGNEFGDWVGTIAGQLGINGNISADPLFCNWESGDFTLEESSPCAPENASPECGLIGALPVGCAGTPVTAIGWGGIKALYRK
jgi:predicted outer membrane repeat protein